MDTTAREVRATLSHIRFQNEESGFIIGEFYGEDRKMFCALGNMLEPQPNNEYVLYGRWTEHHSFGLQFNFSTYRTEQPKSERGIFNYIRRICKWIGPSIGNKLVDAYGKDTLTVLKTKPEEIASTIQGITPERAAEIQKKLIDSEQTEEAMVELGELFSVPGMKRKLIFDVIKDYGANAPAKVRENPYIITNYRGIGFKTADTVALAKINIDRESMFRKTSAAEYVISELMQQSGSVWIERSLVVSSMKSLLGIDSVEDGIERTIKDEKVAEMNGHLSLFKKAKNESEIAHKIALMLLEEY